MKLDFAVLKAIRKSSGWMNGAVVVEIADGEYEAYPGAYMAGFGGSRRVVFAVADASDVLGDDPTGYSDELLLDYINDIVIPQFS